MDSMCVLASDCVLSIVTSIHGIKLCAVLHKLFYNDVWLDSNMIEHEHVFKPCLIGYLMGIHERKQMGVDYKP